ncbi:pericentriolar material 1 protein isoform X4 [Denticeps clupeoides]|uniref:pericentriolar material 1 protein isoform X4 n=1 Tax=Denticeps clupeoides TaxID=299321 RepID=UPI0010A38212|nr:pericentriolar material 1 protein isoform X4 [Denticeps clupeoides]
MATGGASFDEGAAEQELHNWTISNGSLDDRLNNMDWGVQQKKANRSSEKNKKKFSPVSGSRLTNDISPESTPGAGRRRIRTPHSFPHVKYATQMSVPDQTELERLRQRINFTDLDERSIGSDSQGRVTAANNQRQLSENKKPFNVLPLHVNTNKSKDMHISSAASTPAAKDPKKQGPGKDIFAPGILSGKGEGAADRGAHVDEGQRQTTIDSSQVVSKLVQIREYIGKASSMRDDLVEKNDIPANVERLSHLIAHLKEQEKSYLRFLQKMLIYLEFPPRCATVPRMGPLSWLTLLTPLQARENEEDEDGGTIDSAVGSGSVAESTSLNVEPCAGVCDRTGRSVRGEQKEELENLRKQHDLLRKMLSQQEQLRALQGRQAALLAMQQSAEHAIQVMDETVVTETTGSVSGISITSELNDELNDLIQRFHNQLHDSQTKAVPDNRQQAESLSLSREVCRARVPLHPLTHPPAPHTPSGATSAAGAKLTKLQELQDKKQTMDKILQELHSLRDQTLNNKCQGMSSQRGPAAVMSSERPSILGHEANWTVESRQDSYHSAELEDNSHTGDKLRKLKEVHKRLNELRELVQYYEQTSDMMVDTVNENVKDDEEETEDGSLFEAMFDSEQENREPVTNIRNPNASGNWMDMNSLTNARSSSCINNREGRLNTECEINNRSAANLRSLNIPAIECQYNQDSPYNQTKDDSDEDDEDDALDEGGVHNGGRDSDCSESSHQSSLGHGNADFAQKVHRLQTAKQKLWQLQELVAMVQSDDTDGTTANEDDGLHQQPNNTRTPAPRAQSDLSLSDKAREKLYEEKLKQQHQELKQLHEERQRLMVIQDKIQDLQWACPDLQSSVSSSVSNPVQRKLPAAASNPATGPSTSAKANKAALKPTAEAGTTSVPDDELWNEMRRHQIVREELRQRRKQLESLMAEQQRRTVLSDAPCRKEVLDSHVSHSLSRDERTMATWGGSTPCHLDEDEDEDGYPSEEAAEDDSGEESSSTDELHAYSNRKQCSHNRKTRASSKPKQQPQQPGSGRRQENLRWAADLSFSEGNHQWQEQVSQLQNQLDFSTSMCQTLMQDQQTLSYMLQTLLTGPYNVLPSNLGSPQVQLLMHQVNQCYTQLAWQQNNVQRLKQALNELLRQQQSQHQGSVRDSSTCPVSPSVFLPCALPPATALNIPGLTSYSPVAPGLHIGPFFPSTAREFPQSSAAQISPKQQPQQQQQPDPNASIKTEYMSFPPPLQRSPLNTTDQRLTTPANSVPDPQNSSWLSSSHINQSFPVPVDQSASLQQHSPSSSHLPRDPRARSFHKGSQESLSSIPDPSDPTIVTKTYQAGRKASAQASLASRDKTPVSKNRKRKTKAYGKNTVHVVVESDSASSSANYTREKERGSALLKPQDHNQKLLDKLTQEKLDSKTRNSKPSDASTAYAWRTPFLSNRIACTEAQDASSDFSLFEALRETIYSEVATLISQNESRPHFLIELFHELQLLNTDYLRQRALYSLQDIVTKHLSEKNVVEDQTSSLGPAVWAAGSQSELTPSESLTTSDADTSEKNLGNKQNSQDIRQTEGDSMDNESFMSMSSNLEPFASDDLGNTVIHLDQALARIREYERMKLKSEFKYKSNKSASDAAVASASEASKPEPSATCAGQLEGQSSALVHCPQIDTQQLDRQIKAIMTEVIPFLKERMDEICSHQLLTSVRRMVLTLTHQYDESKEFVRFFHRQLGGILQESLCKFVGQTLQDCGEDLLVEISETLFNELAFFRLMQDLDGSSTTTPKTCGKKSHQSAIVKHKDQLEGKKSDEGEKAVSPTCYDEDKDQDETEQDRASRYQEKELQEEKNGHTSDASEIEEGEGDDYDYDEEVEDDRQGVPLSISLSKAETQALTNYGSGEDENELEEMEEFEAGPVEVQTSLQASTDIVNEDKQSNGGLQNGTQEDDTSSKSVQETSESSDVKGTTSVSVEKVDSPDGLCQAGDEKAEVPCATMGSQGSSTGSPDTESPVMVNADEVCSGNISQKSDEEDFVKVEDLPLQLTVMCEEELRKRITEEQKNNNLSAEILNGNTESLTGLVGNAHTLKEPGNHTFIKYFFHYFYNSIVLDSHFSFTIQ